MPPMEKTVQADSSTSSFAGLLAALAAPKPQKQPAAAPVGDPLAEPFQDDVVTLSYESALKTHARYRQGNKPALPPISTAGPMAGSAAESSIPTSTAAVSKPEISNNKSAPPAEASATAAKRSMKGNENPLEQNRKRASVTLRMSAAECAQLQQRAAEAGMTVSAYLRSCAFEVESLRAQVKQVLSELRAAQATKPADGRILWLRLFHRKSAPLSAAKA